LQVAYSLFTEDIENCSVYDGTELVNLLNYSIDIFILYPFVQIDYGLWSKNNIGIWCWVYICIISIYPNILGCGGSSIYGVCVCVCRMYNAAQTYTTLDFL